jgi:hypothetical protein
VVPVDSTVTTPQAREALLASIARHDRFVVLTGETRSGKTTLCRSVIATGGIAASWIDARAPLTFHEILQQVAADVQAGANPPATADDLALAASEQELIALIERGVDTNARHAAVIVVDEAHVLNRLVIGKMQALVELGSSERGVTVLLSGHPPLEQTLDTPECQALKPLISTRLRLRSPSDSERPAAKKDTVPVSARSRLRPGRALVLVAGVALVVGIGWLGRAVAPRPARVRAPIPASAPAAPPSQSQPPEAPAAPTVPPVAAARASSAPAATPAPPTPDARAASTLEMDAKLEQLHHTMEREAIELARRGDVTALLNLRARTEAAYAQIGAHRPDFLAALLGELDGYISQARGVRRP